MPVSTYSLLDKALSRETSKKLKTRKKNWVAVQKRLHLKDKGILEQVRKAVESGVSKKRAHDLITVIYSSKKRDLVPDFDAPRNVSLKSSKTSSKSSRFEKAEKRKRDEEVIPRKKYIEDEYQHFPIFSKSKVVAWIGDDVMKFVLAGDYQEVEKRLSTQDAFRTQDGKIRDEALKSTEFASFVRNSLIETTKAIYKYQSSIYKSAEINDLCKKITGYANLLQQGKSIDFLEVGDAVKRLNTLYVERNGKLSEPLSIDDSSLKAFVTKSANIVTDARIHQEDLHFLEEAAQNSEELRVKSEQEAKEALDGYNKAKRQREVEPQADSYEQDMKRKKEGEILQAQYANSFMEKKTKTQNFERTRNLNWNAIEESEKNWQEYVFNETFLKSLVAFSNDLQRIFQSVLAKVRQHSRQQENAVNQAEAAMPQVLDWLSKNATEATNALPPKEDHDAEVARLRRLAQEQAEIGVSNGEIEDDKGEEINDLDFMLKQNAHGRATGESSESGAALRQKRKEAEIKKENAHNARVAAERLSAEYTAQADQKEAEYTNVQQNAESVRQTREQASAFRDQSRINTTLNEENIKEGNSYVETFNLIKKQVENIEIIGQANIHNQAKEKPIQDIDEDDFSEIRNDEPYAKRIDDQLSQLRDSKQRFIAMRDSLQAGDPEIFNLNDIIRSIESSIVGLEARKIEETSKSLKRQGYSVDSKTEKAFKDVFRDQDIRQDPRYGAQAQQRVPTTADVKIEPSIEKTLINLQVPQYQQKSDLLNIPLSGRPAFAKKPATPKKYRAQGGFVVGSRPDPFINRAYWKNVYQRLNK